MEGGDRRAVGDGHQRRIRQPRLQRAIKFGFRLRIQAGGRLVQEQPVRLRQQGARQCDALLLAAGQLLRPVLVVVEPGDELRQAGILERPRDLLAAVACRADADR